MHRSKLVTVLGCGGMGKTRVAAEIARRSARSHDDSVCWVDLAQVIDPESILESVAEALALRNVETHSLPNSVLSTLREHNSLLVFDNCEHLVFPLGEFITVILANAPSVRILATSREPLNIGSEVTYHLPPLTLPMHAEAEAERVTANTESEAVALFVERARAAVPDFRLTQANANSIALLCIALDGLPLAVELAAGRIRTLSPRQILDKLGDRFALLTGGDRAARPQQQTLQAVVDWSYELCSELERELWAALSVFPGSFDLDAAEAIGASGTLLPGDVLDVLSGLVSKSIVVVDRSTECWRYSQLVTLREYGQQKSIEYGLSERCRRNHRDHYLQRNEATTRNVYENKTEQAEFSTWWRVEHGNLTTALNWSTSHTGETGAAVRIAVGLLYHWISDGVLHEARRSLGRLLLTLGPPTRERGEVLWVTAWIALVQGDHSSARQLLAECKSLAERFTDDILLARHDHVSALASLFAGDTASSILLYQRAIEAYRAAHLPEVANATFQLSIALIYAGRPEETLDTCRRIIERSDTQYERWNMPFALWVSAVAQLHLDRTMCAVAAARDALTLQLDYQDRICSALTIEVLAWSAERDGLHARSAQLFGAAQYIWDELGTTVSAFGPGIGGDSQSSRSRVQATLGDHTFDELSMPTSHGSVGAAIAFALQDHDTTPVRPAEKTSPLTKRETEVAMLVAEGLRNRQIAEKLVVSPRTIDGHVERILTKLDMRSRAQLGAWVQKHLL